MNLEQIVANSYRNFHARGLDYLCLKRTPDLTIKVYFFDGPESQLAQLPEIVAPHDHRYNFDTQILQGRVTNLRYGEHKIGSQKFQKFAWDTPLNGGKGFTHMGEAKLAIFDKNEYSRGGFERWSSRYNEIHTLRVQEQGSVIVLSQYADVIPVGTPTLCYHKGDDPVAPSLTGLYDEMDESDVIARIRQVRALAPGLVGPA